MSVRYDGERSLSRRREDEFLENNEFNLANRNIDNMVGMF
jgi:hypothetical protein